MIASSSLLAIAGVLLVMGPRLASTPWSRQAPRVAILTWQASTVGFVATVALAGLTMLIPLTPLTDDLGSVLEACAASIAAAYGSPGFLPGALLGVVLAGVVPAWVVLCALRVWIASRRTRRGLQRSLRLVTEPGPVAGVVVLDAPTPAAFCVPGRTALTVITRGALDQLSPRELEGVLAHEAAHLQGHHDLAVALSTGLARAFPHVRLFQVAARETRELIEMLADDAALRRVDRVNLASAIVSLAEMKTPSAAMAMAQDGAFRRVTRLLSHQPPLQPWRPRAAALGALAIVVAPMFVAGYPAVCAALTDLCTVS